MRWDHLNGTGIVRKPLSKQLCDVHASSIPWNGAPATSLHIPVQTPKSSITGNEQRGAGTDQPWQAVTGAVDPAACAVKLSLTPPQSVLLEPWNGFSISQTVSYQITESIFKEVFASLNFVWIKKKWESWRESKAHVFLERKKARQQNCDQLESSAMRMALKHLQPDNEGQARRRKEWGETTALCRPQPILSVFHSLPSPTEPYLYAAKHNRQIRPALKSPGTLPAIAFPPSSAGKVSWLGRRFSLQGWHSGIF